MLLSLSGSGALVEAKLDLAGGLSEPAVACKKRMSDFNVPCVEPFVFVFAKQKHMGTKAYAFISLDQVLLWRPGWSWQVFFWRKLRLASDGCHISKFYVWNLLFLCLQNRIGQKPMLLSLSGSGAFVEAKWTWQVIFWSKLLLASAGCQIVMVPAYRATFCFCACKTEVCMSFSSR